jgi:hypothetical protein
MRRQLTVATRDLAKPGSRPVRHGSRLPGRLPLPRRRSRRGRSKPCPRAIFQGNEPRGRGLIDRRGSAKKDRNGYRCPSRRRRSNWFTQSPRRPQTPGRAGGPRAARSAGPSSRAKEPRDSWDFGLTLSKRTKYFHCCVVDFSRFFRREYAVNRLDRVEERYPLGGD